jgi:hypothetical protein
VPADTLPAAWRILHSPTNVMAPGSTARDIRLLWLLAASNAARLAPGRASIVPFLDKQTHPKNYVLCTPEGLEILANYSREVRRQTPRAHVHTDPPVPLLPHPPPSSCSQCTGEWLCKYREKSRHAHSTHDVSHILRLLNQAGVGRYEAGGFFVEALPNADGPLGVAGIELRHAVAELTWKPKDREKQAAFDRKLALWRHAAVAAQRALPARGAVSAEEGVPPALAQNDRGVASA